MPHPLRRRLRSALLGLDVQDTEQQCLNYIMALLEGQEAAHDIHQLLRDVLTGLERGSKSTARCRLIAAHHALTLHGSYASAAPAELAALVTPLVAYITSQAVVVNSQELCAVGEQIIKAFLAKLVQELMKCLAAAGSASDSTLRHTEYLLTECLLFPVLRVARRSPQKSSAVMASLLSDRLLNCCQGFVHVKQVIAAAGACLEHLLGPGGKAGGSGELLVPELLLPVQRCLELLSIGLDAAAVRRVVVVCSASATSQTWQVRQQALSTLAILVSSVQLADPLLPGEQRLVITPAVKAVQRHAAAILQVLEQAKADKVAHVRQAAQAVFAALDTLPRLSEDAAAASTHTALSGAAMAAPLTRQLASQAPAPQPTVWAGLLPSRYATSAAPAARARQPARSVAAGASAAAVQPGAQTGSSSRPQSSPTRTSELSARPGLEPRPSSSPLRHAAAASRRAGTETTAQEAPAGRLAAQGMSGVIARGTVAPLPQQVPAAALRPHRRSRDDQREGAEHQPARDSSLPLTSAAAGDRGVRRSAAASALPSHRRSTSPQADPNVTTTLLPANTQPQAERPKAIAIANTPYDQQQQQGWSGQTVSTWRSSISPPKPAWGAGPGGRRSTGSADPQAAAGQVLGGQQAAVEQRPAGDAAAELLPHRRLSGPQQAAASTLQRKRWSVPGRASRSISPEPPAPKARPQVIQQSARPGQGVPAGRQAAVQAWGGGPGQRPKSAGRTQDGGAGGWPRAAVYASEDRGAQPMHGFLRADRNRVMLEVPDRLELHSVEPRIRRPGPLPEDCRDFGVLLYCKPRPEIASRRPSVDVSAVAQPGGTLPLQPQAQPQPDSTEAPADCLASQVTAGSTYTQGSVAAAGLSPALPSTAQLLTAGAPLPLPAWATGDNGGTVVGTAAESGHERIGDDLVSTIPQPDGGSGRGAQTAAVAPHRHAPGTAGRGEAGAASATSGAPMAPQSLAAFVHIQDPEHMPPIVIHVHPPGTSQGSVEVGWSTGQAQVVQHSSTSLFTQAPSSTLRPTGPTQTEGRSGQQALGVPSESQLQASAEMHSSGHPAAAVAAPVAFATGIVDGDVSTSASASVLLCTPTSQAVMSGAKQPAGESHPASAQSFVGSHHPQPHHLSTQPQQEQQQQRQEPSAYAAAKPSASHQRSQLQRQAQAEPWHVHLYTPSPAHALSAAAESSPHSLVRFASVFGSPGASPSPDQRTHAKSHHARMAATSASAATGSAWVAGGQGAQPHPARQAGQQDEGRSISPGANVAGRSSFAPDRPIISPHASPSRAGSSTSPAAAKISPGWGRGAQAGAGGAGGGRGDAGSARRGASISPPRQAQQRTQRPPPTSPSQAPTSTKPAARAGPAVRQAALQQGTGATASHSAAPARTAEEGLHPPAYAQQGDEAGVWVGGVAEEGRLPEEGSKDVFSGKGWRPQQQGPWQGGGRAWESQDETDAAGRHTAAQERPRSIAARSPSRSPPRSPSQSPSRSPSCTPSRSPSRSRADQARDEEAAGAQVVVSSTPFSMHGAHAAAHVRVLDFRSLVGDATVRPQVHDLSLLGSAASTPAKVAAGSARARASSTSQARASAISNTLGILIEQAQQSLACSAEQEGRGSIQEGEQRVRPEGFGSLGGWMPQAHEASSSQAGQGCGTAAAGPWRRWVDDTLPAQAPPEIVTVAPEEEQVVYGELGATPQPSPVFMPIPAPGLPLDLSPLFAAGLLQATGTPALHPLPASTPAAGQRGASLGAGYAAGGGAAYAAGRAGQTQASVGLRRSPVSASDLLGSPRSGGRRYAAATQGLADARGSSVFTQATQQAQQGQRGQQLVLQPQPASPTSTANSAGDLVAFASVTDFAQTAGSGSSTMQPLTVQPVIPQGNAAAAIAEGGVRLVIGRLQALQSTLAAGDSVQVGSYNTADPHHMAYDPGTFPGNEMAGSCQQPSGSASPATPRTAHSATSAGPTGGSPWYVLPVLGAQEVAPGSQGGTHGGADDEGIWSPSPAVASPLRRFDSVQAASSITQRQQQASAAAAAKSAQHSWQQGLAPAAPSDSQRQQGQRDALLLGLHYNDNGGSYVPVDEPQFDGQQREQRSDVLEGLTAGSINGGGNGEISRMLRAHQETQQQVPAASTRPQLAWPWEQPQGAGPGTGTLPLPDIGRGGRYDGGTASQQQSTSGTRYGSSTQQSRSPSHVLRALVDQLHSPVPGTGWSAEARDEAYCGLSRMRPTSQQPWMQQSAARPSVSQSKPSLNGATAALSQPPVRLASQTRPSTLTANIKPISPTRLQMHPVMQHQQAAAGVTAASTLVGSHYSPPAFMQTPLPAAGHKTYTVITPGSSSSATASNNQLSTLYTLQQPTVKQAQHSQLVLGQVGSLSKTSELLRDDEYMVTTLTEARTARSIHVSATRTRGSRDMSPKAAAGVTNRITTTAPFANTMPGTAAVATLAASYALNHAYNLASSTTASSPYSFVPMVLSTHP